MLPERDGFQVCRNLRDAGVSIPILMLTARSTTIDTVTGLRTGADDYLTKPFDMQELLARVYALLRRQQRQGKEADPIEPIIRFGDFSIDTRKQELRRKTESIPLNTKEYRLLKYLVENPHRVIGRNRNWERNPAPVTSSPFAVKGIGSHRTSSRLLSVP
jgi:DNA-binding response OmpR family regulator